MSAQLVTRGLAAGHGTRTLFTDLDLVVAPGDVVGLVGPNGSGKSTLLRMLAGQELPSSGRVELSPARAQVGLLPQESDRPPGETLRDHLGRRTGVDDARRAMEAAADALAEGAAGAEDAYDEALQRWLSLGGADLEERAVAQLARSGLEVPLDRSTRSLSGGEFARLALAALLLSRYDVLLLDEPTNDLDLAALEQLEEFVRSRSIGVVVVSHDREFLSRTVTSVLELDLHQQRVQHYGGGYEAYLVERERNRRHARERYEEYAETLTTLRERARTQRNWAAKGARSARRDPRDPDKFVKHFNVASAEKQAAKARQTDRMIERLEEVDEPRREWQLQMSVADAPPSGRVVAVLREATVRRDGFTLGPVTMQVDRGDRIAITGPNGAGKTTLLDVLLGRTPPDGGHASLGASVRVGEVEQTRSSMDADLSLLDAMRVRLPDAGEAELRTLLAKFGLGGEHVLRPPRTLSAGERTRAGLAVLQARGVNVLVLDEPTNHLDLPAIEQLETALEAYAGTLIVVTHDRRMLANLRITRRFHVDHGTVSELRSDPPTGG